MSTGYRYDHQSNDRKSDKKYYCNNCGLVGHTFNRCSEPITSLGLIVYRFNPIKRSYEFIMINRKDSLGFVDLIRGKYNIHNIMYLQNIINEMTIEEKRMIENEPFENLWAYMWNFRNISSRYKSEYEHSLKKFETLKKGIDTTQGTFTLRMLLENSDTNWLEPEWGFPKGRRNYKETDLHTALREFEEETGIKPINVNILKNIMPYDENFTGSNYKSYRSRYFIAKIDYMNNVEFCKQDCEVRQIGWYTYKECVERIRSTNKEKLEMLDKIHQMLCKYTVM
jgi:8-oxo-dGTP pyrophosphatase MutT (NUDIX family)